MHDVCHFIGVSQQLHLWLVQQGEFFLASNHTIGMNRDQPGVFFSYFSRCCMLVVPSTKWQLLFVTTRRGTTGDMVQRHLIRYYSRHIAGNAGESAKSIGDAPFLRRWWAPFGKRKILYVKMIFVLADINKP